MHVGQGHLVRLLAERTGDGYVFRTFEPSGSDAAATRDQNGVTETLRSAIKKVQKAIEAGDKLVDLGFRRHAAGRIGRRIDDDAACPVRDRIQNRAGTNRKAVREKSEICHAAFIHRNVRPEFEGVGPAR